MNDHDADQDTQASDEAALRRMTERQLGKLGLSQLAYVRPVMMDGAMAYAIHEADGTPMALATDRTLAEAAIEHQDLVEATLH